MSDKKLSVGEEAIQWAEKYWLMDKFLKGEIKNDDGQNEAMSYDYFRRVLVDRINGIITERLVPPPAPDESNMHSI